MNLIKKLNKKYPFYIKTIKKTFKIIQSHIKCFTQIYIKSLFNIELKIKNKKIENLEYIYKDLIVIEIYKNKKKNITYCNNLKLNNIKKCIENTINNINSLSKDKYITIPSYKSYIQKYEKNLGLIFNDNLSLNDMINISINTEQNSLNYKKNLISDNTTFSTNLYCITIYNNYNIIKNYISKNYLLTNNIIAKKKKNMEYSFDYIQSHKLSDILHNYHKLGKNNAKKAISKLDSKQIKTKKYKILFNNKTSIEIFKYLIESIKGYNIYNKTSFLINKLNKQILPNWLSIKEDPFIFKGIGSKPFDDEGINTKKYTIIKNGILKTWILDTYSSKKLNITNTSNSGGIHNWVFKKKKTDFISYKKLVSKMNNGLIINELLGQGVNINNGNFSKGASGYLVKNNKIKYPVNEITISGNLKSLFKNIIDISNDINYYSKIRIGSILICKIQVGGK